MSKLKKKPIYTGQNKAPKQEPTYAVVGDQVYDINSDEYRKLYQSGLMPMQDGLPTMVTGDFNIVGKKPKKLLSRKEKAQKRIQEMMQADINQPGGLQRGAEVMSFPLRGAAAAANILGETMNTPLALAGEYISGRGDYGAALPNIYRSMENAGLTGFGGDPNANQQMTPGNALFPNNPYAAMALDIPADMLISRGANTVFNPIFKQGLTEGTKTIARELTKNRMGDIPGTVSYSGFAPNLSGTADEVTKEGNLVIKKKFNRNKTTPERIDVEGKSGSWQLKKNNAGENLWYFSANMDNPVESGKAAMKMNELFPLPNPSILEPNSLSLDSYPLLLKMGKRPNWSMSFEDYIPLNYSHKHSNLIDDLGLSSKDETYRLMSQETADEIANRVNSMLSEKGIEQKARTFQVGDYRGIELPNFKLTRDYQNGGKVGKKKIKLKKGSKINELSINSPEYRQLYESGTLASIDEEGVPNMYYPEVNVVGDAPLKLRKKRQLAKADYTDEELERYMYQGKIPDRDKDFLLPPGERLKIYNAVLPFEYPDKELPKALRRYITGEERKFLGQESIKEEDRDLGRTDEDAWAHFMGLPQLYNTVDKSEYLPTDSKNKNAEYYTIRKGYPDFDELLLENAHNWFQRKENTNANTLRGVGSPFMPLENVTYSKGQDERGKYYSMYDVYDFNVPYQKGIGKPYEVYDRVYYDDTNPDKPVVLKKSYGGKITNMKKKKSNNLPKYYNGTPGLGTPGTQGSLFNMLSGLQQLGNTQNPTLGNQNPNSKQMDNQNLSNMNVTGKGMSDALQGATGPLAGVMKMLNGPLAPLAGMAMSSVTDMVHAINTPERERRPTLQNASSYTFDNGGTIKIKPSKKGTFTKAAKKHGKSVQAFASQVLANKDNYSPAMVKKANFARNAAKWKKAVGGVVRPEEGYTLMPNDEMQFANMPAAFDYANGGLTGTYMDAFDAMAFGGMIDPSMAMQQMMYGSYAQGGQVPQNIPVEVEGEEMYEMPNGQVGEFSGPKHENGGMPMALPEGTKIYSDRLKVNGKTMAARKDKREANIAKLEKLLTKNPNDKFIKEALKRQQETNALQEQGDMQQQEMANEQQAQEEMAMEEMLMGAAQQDMQEGMMMAMGGMIKRADGSYSKRGLWDNIRANKGSGKKPTKEMLKQEKKIRAAQKAYGGMVEYAGGGRIPTMLGNIAGTVTGIHNLNRLTGPVKKAFEPLSTNPFSSDINMDLLSKSGSENLQALNLIKTLESDVATNMANNTNPYDAMTNVLGNTLQNPGELLGNPLVDYNSAMPDYISTKKGVINLKDTPTGFVNPMFTSSSPDANVAVEPGSGKGNRFMNFLNNAVDKTGDFFSGLFDRSGNPKRGTNTNSDYDLTEGDKTGMLGTSIGMYGPALMTMLNKMQTPPNTNYFSTFGQDALRTQEEAEGLAGISKDEAYRKNLMRANALRKQLANTARGVNDIRSGQLTAELAEQEGARGILTDYLQGMSQLKGQRAGLQQQIDQTRMGGEYQRDLADRQDVDQYYTNLAENVANASNMMQKQGRDLNVVQYNKDIMNLSKAYSKYGIYAVRDPKSGLLTLAHKGADGKITYLSEEEAEELAKQQSEKQPEVTTTKVEEPK